MSNDSNSIKADAWVAADSTFAAHCARRHVALKGTFELTARCNFNCKMCYIHMTDKEISSSGADELTTREWLKLAEDAIENGTLHLLLTGGEPLLRSDFEELYTEFCKMGFIVSINTNASLMNDRYYKLFSRYPPSSVAVTLYGADEDTYKSVCGNPDFFGQTIRGLQYWAEIPTNIEVRTTFIKDNMHQLDKLREIANRFTKTYAVNYMVFKAVPGVMSEVEQCRLSAKECFDIRESNVLYYNKLNENNQDKSQDEGFADISFDGLDKDDPKIRDDGMDVFPEILTCLAAKAAYWIRWDGKMLPCGSFVWPYSLPLVEGFKTAWDRLPELLIDMKHPQKCIECVYYHNCPNCPAYLQMETGSFDEPADYVCDMAKERNTRHNRKVLS